MAEEEAVEVTTGKTSEIGGGLGFGRYTKPAATVFGVLTS
jgi:hypothetical protein